MDHHARLGVRPFIGPLTQMQRVLHDRGKIEGHHGHPPTEGTKEYLRGWAEGAELFDAEARMSPDESDAFERGRKDAIARRGPMERSPVYRQGYDAHCAETE